MGTSGHDGAVPRSLVWATNIDVLPADHTAERRAGYLAVRSPHNPGHYWGTLLVFDEAPVAGDRARWERLFEAEFGGDPRVRHRTFAWDQTGGERGAAGEEFLSHGYDLEVDAGLIAAPDDIHEHPRANREVEVRPLDPAGDESLWDEVLEIWVVGRDAKTPEAEHREYARHRLADLRRTFSAGRGAWYVALAGGEVAGSCGVVVTGGRGRFQAVDTVEPHRRRGICSRLVVDAAHHAAAEYGARRLVIAADPDYHALGLYQSLGFALVEQVCGVCKPPVG
jgi:ribosomal protein S18 acetylase RimI-like enzyme